jgi:hypothetical protein
VGRRPLPPPAPLPAYQKNFRGEQYPTPDRQHGIHSQQYSYRPKEPVVRGNYAAQAEHSRSAPRGGHPEEGPKRR